MTTKRSVLVEWGRFWLEFGPGHEPNECKICGRSLMTFGFDGVGHLCLRHTVDFALDDYTSKHEYVER